MPAQYIRLYDLGRKVEVRNIRTYLPCRATFFLMNLHTYSRPIWLARAAPREAYVYIPPSASALLCTH